MAVLNICDCVLRLKNIEGAMIASDAELSVSPRKSQMNSGDALYIARPMRDIAKPGIVIQDLNYIAKETPETVITVTYTSGATAGSEVVTVVGNAISVQIANSVSTATQVQTAINNSVAASALVYCLISGTAGDAQVIVSATDLDDKYCYLPLVETTTNSLDLIFTLGYTDQDFYNNIVSDPIQIPDQTYLDLSTIITISRG